MNQSQKWITKHFEELVSRYGGKYIGVAGRQVVGYAFTPKEAMRQARKLVKGEVVSPPKVSTEEELVCIL